MVEWKYIGRHFLLSLRGPGRLIVNRLIHVLSVAISGYVFPRLFHCLRNKSDPQDHVANTPRGSSKARQSRTAQRAGDMTQLSTQPPNDMKRPTQGYSPPVSNLNKSAAYNNSSTTGYPG